VTVQILTVPFNLASFIEIDLCTLSYADEFELVFHILAPGKLVMSRFPCDDSFAVRSREGEQQTLVPIFNMKSNPEILKTPSE